MKKILLIACTVLAFAACNKDITIQPSGDDSVYSKKLVVDIKITADDDTKAVQSSWESGDVVYVFFSNIAISDPAKYLTLTYDGSKWAADLHNIDPAEFAESGARMSAIWFPYIGGGLEVNYDMSRYRFSYNGLPICSHFLSCENASYTFTLGGDANKLSGTLDMRPVFGTPTLNPSAGEMWMHLFIGSLSASQAEHYWLSEPDFSPAAVTSINGYGNITVTRYPAGTPVPGHAYSGGASFAGIMASYKAYSGDYNFTLYTNDGALRPSDYRAYTMSGTKDLSPKTVLPDVGTPYWTMAGEPDYIDLGLSVKWANRNLDGAPGAQTLAYDSRDYGYYFGSGYGYMWDASWESSGANGYTIPTYDQMDELCGMIASGGKVVEQNYTFKDGTGEGRPGHVVYGYNGMCIYFPTFDKNVYWSCTEDAGTYAWNLYFGTGSNIYPSSSDKGSYLLLRPVQVVAGR